MNQFDTLENTGGRMTICYSPEFEVVCAVTDVPFTGTLEIVYTPERKLLEYVSFEGWLRSLARNRLTIEDFCRLVYRALREALGDIGLSVTVRARTPVHAPVCASIDSEDEDDEETDLAYSRLDQRLHSLSARS